MKRILIAWLAMAAAVAWPAVSEAFQAQEDYPTGQLAVKVWLNEANGTVYKPGRDVSVRFQANQDCYAVVYNVDTQGFVNVLFPKPDENSWVEAGQVYGIPGPEDGYDLVVDGPKGIEYVVAVASPYQLDVGALYPDAEPVDRDAFHFSGRVTGDPEQAIYEINELLAWGDAEYSPAGYASDMSWFYVGRRVPFPRYLVYQWYPDRYLDPYWDPYVHAGIFIDFHWDNDWCRPWWWRHGHRPHYNHWFVDHRGGKPQGWSFTFIREKHKSGWDDYHPVTREKSPRYIDHGRRGDGYERGPFGAEPSRRIKDARPGERDLAPGRLQDVKGERSESRPGRVEQTPRAREERREIPAESGRGLRKVTREERAAQDRSKSSERKQAGRSSAKKIEAKPQERRGGDDAAKSDRSGRDRSSQNNEPRHKR